MMNGLELAKNYYETYARPMLHKKYPEYESRIAVGLVGEGSECFGFDDALSRDHDFGPALCLWLEEGDYREIGSRLQQDYEQLPARMEGLEARRDNAMTGHRIGVWETGEFYRHFLGRSGVPESPMDWLRLPDSYLAVATNGQVFRDDLGHFSQIRRHLLEGRPEDVRIKKMVARAAVMAQAGQYNYPRCVSRGEMVAASLALAEFMRHAMEMVYLLNSRYAPFYKWMHRGLGELKMLGELKGLFAKLADAGDCGTGTEPVAEAKASGTTDSNNTSGEHGGIRISPREKQEVIEEICKAAAAELNAQGLTSRSDPFLQVHLDEMMSRISRPEIRRLHWLVG